MTVYVIEIPEEIWPGLLLSANGSYERYGRARQVYDWRRVGKVLAAGRDLPAAILGPVHIRAEFRFPTKRRRDTANLYPTIKALVDGLVDGGLLPDDCDGIVEGPHLTRTWPNGPKRIRLILTTLSPEELGQEHPAGGA